jgi:CBS domain-containing protein
VFLRDVLTSSRVGQLPLVDIPILGTSDTVRQAAAQMRTRSHGSALVCQAEKLVGIFTERDLLQLMASGESLDQPLSAAMTKNPQTVSTEDSLLKVLKLMDEGGYRRLPVVNGQGAPTGLIDVKSVAYFLVEHFPAAVYNQAPRALLTAKTREGA